MQNRGIPDQALLLRAQQGDKQAFNLLAEKYRGRLWRLVQRFVKDWDEAEDVAQEALIKAFRALPSFRGDSAFYTWLYRIGVNTAANHLVARRRRPPTYSECDSQEAENFEDADQLRDSSTPEDTLISKQALASINEALDALPPDLRDTMVLREIDCLSYEEIATVMNCPIGTVRSRLFRAREAVFEKIADKIGAVPADPTAVKSNFL